MNIKLVNENFQENYLENLLRARGIKDVQEYLDPPPSVVQDPSDLKNIAYAAALYLRVVLNDKPPYSRILLVVDSDLDGFSSATIFYQYTKQVNCHCQIDYLLHDGKQHGLADHIDSIINSNIHYDLIVLPDSSSNDESYHNILGDLHIPCLVLDHHIIDLGISDNAVIVNNQLSPNYANKELVGAGVVYQFCRYIDSKLHQDWANLYIDLAALGQIGDMGSVIPLENRYIIKQGLSHIRNKFFIALLEKQAYSITGVVAPSFEQIVAATNPISVAFYIVPLVNALIRVGTMEEKELMFKAFINGDEMVPCNKRGAKGTLERAAIEAARVCTNARAHQNKIKDQMTEILETRIFKYDLLENKILFITLTDEDKFPAELNGLVAMSLVSKFKHPTIIGRLNDEGYIRGSIRGLSNSKFDDFKKFLVDSKYFEYVLGHANAAGASIPSRTLDDFLKYSNEKLKDFDFNENEYCVNFSTTGLNWSLPQIVENLCSVGGIWGQGSPEPLIYVKDIPFSKTNVQIMGSNKDTLKISHNGIAYMKFHAKDLIEEIQDIGSGTIEVVGTPNMNYWGGQKTPQIFINAYELKRLNESKF